MPNDRPAKVIWEARVKMDTGRGQPSKTWDCAVASIIEKRGLTQENAKKIAKSKKKWTEIVYKYQYYQQVVIFVVPNNAKCIL